MKKYTITYFPIWSQFTRESVNVMANSFEQAEIRFWATSASDNCQYIIQID